MSLLQSLCCLFAGRCVGEEVTPTKQTPGEPPVSGDLGQKEAELEKAKEEELRRMERGQTEN